MERVLGGGERHEHRLAVEAGWYVRLEIEQVGVDVAASLLGPDGAVLFSTDDPDGLKDKEILAVIAPAAGELVLAVAPRDPQTSPGAYRVSLTARRPAGPGDSERAAAQKAVAEALLRLRTRDPQGKREAIPLLEEAARLWGVTGELAAQVEALRDIGATLISLSDLPAGREALERALSISLQSEDLKLQATCHNNLAYAYQRLGEREQTLDHYQRALDLWRKVGDAQAQGVVLYSVGIFHRDRGDFDLALQYLSQALPLRHDVGDIMGELYTLLALANVQLGRGEMEQALGRLDEALQLSRSVGTQGVGPVLAVEAQFHRHRGELGEALASLSDVRDLYQRTGNTAYEARSLHQLGALYLDLGDLKGAQDSFEKGLVLVSGLSSDESRIRNSLGWTQYLLGDKDAALQSFERALTLSREKNLPSGIAQALDYTGLVYLDIGRAGEGLQLLRESLALRRQNGDRWGEAKSLLALGRAQQALGELNQAGISFQQAFELGRQVGDTDLVAACLYRWAVLDRQRGDLQEALGRVEEALRIIESVRSRVSSEKLRVTFLASKRAWYELYIDLQMQLEEREPGRGHAIQALEASERARSRGLLDLIAEGRINVQEGIDPELKRRETDLGARLSWIQERIGEMLAQDPEREPTDLRARLDEVGREMEQLEDEIRRRHHRYAEVRYPTPLRLEQIQDLLDEQTALLEYFVGQEGSFLFVVTRDGLSAHRLPAEDVLRKKVQDLRTALLRAGMLTRGRFQIASRDIYNILLAPVAARLEGASDLLISPDGPLTVVPFEVLLSDPSGGASYRDLPYLLRKHSISYVPSASVLAGLREPRLEPEAGTALHKTLIAFGDPIYPAQVAVSPLRAAVSPAAAPRLPGTGDEIEAIARLYPATEVARYVGGDATEENVKANPLLHTAQRIHFATHGLVDEVRPHLSGLMLTRLPDSREDGLLQVHEIFNLRLNAELVTLSACETGLGEQVTGEGMVGLTRAFLYAGARSLLVSLWPVSDRSTPELMTAFYLHLGDTRTKAEALRQAKLERIAKGEEPYRWAPFILAGESR